MDDPEHDDPTTYQANDVNQYTSTSDPAESFAHDLDGNLTLDGQFAYISWDAENRLIAVQTRIDLGSDPQEPDEGDKLVEFKYDYMSRRVQKKVSTWDADLNPNGGGWVEQSITRFVYDGWNVVMVLNGSNEIIGKYTWGLDLSGTIRAAGGIGGLLAGEVYRTPNGGPAGGGNQPEWQKYWFFYDANGNVGQLLRYRTSPSETVSLAAHYEYDPYGNVIVASDADSSGIVTANPFRFSTKWFDAETGLGYWGYRYYSPRLGRWMSRDPIGERGGLNLSAFVHNSPVQLLDPLGLARGYVCCTSTRRGYEIRGFTSPMACAADSLQGQWWTDILQALITEGVVVLTDYGLAVYAGYQLPPITVAGLVAAAAAYTTALQYCMAEHCVSSYAATRTCIVRKWKWDLVCYSCPNGGFIMDPGDFFFDGETPTATSKCVYGWND